MTAGFFSFLRTEDDGAPELRTPSASTHVELGMAFASGTDMGGRVTGISTKGNRTRHGLVHNIYASETSESVVAEDPVHVPPPRSW